MCGISGIIGKGWGVHQLESMVQKQRHRGPDDSGLYISEDRLVGLGHNRLSIIDLSSAGQQPMSNYNGTCWIVFNGEIYNYVELKRELSDYPYKSKTDTEVILAAYEKWGENCVDYFNGMFAFAIWDSEKKRLFCARDRLGIKPFYYIQDGDKFMFASEIKALLSAGWKVSPNWATWATYLVHGYYDHSDETFFADVLALSSGNILIWESERITIKNYWDLSVLAKDQLSLSDEEASDCFINLLEDSVSLRLRSDVPVGVNLSGGLDSASLVSTMDNLLQAEGELKTFTASFSDCRYDEHSFASEVPRQTRWTQHIKRLDDTDVWDLAWHTIWHQEAPFGGIATLAYSKLHNLAKEIGVTVLLEGQGMDEMLGGYDYFRPYYFLDLLEKGKLQLLRQEIRAIQSNSGFWLSAVRQLQSGMNFNTYQDGTSHLRPECVSPVMRDLAGETNLFPQVFSDHLSNALFRDLSFTKLPRVLRMNDRLSMAYGRELREPYLDYRIVEFLFSLPGHQKIRLGRGKHQLRHAMADRLPDNIRLAKKRAVVTPQREWLQTTLYPRVKEIISSASFAERGIFDVRKVHDTFKSFCRSDSSNSFFVWQWINVELWFRTFVDKQSVYCV